MRAARIGVDITKHCVFTVPPERPPMGPLIGTTISASPNAIIGGVPMPSPPRWYWWRSKLHSWTGKIARMAQAIKAGNAFAPAVSAKPPMI